MRPCAPTNRLRNANTLHTLRCATPHAGARDPRKLQRPSYVLREGRRPGCASAANAARQRRGMHALSQQQTLGTLAQAARAAQVRQLRRLERREAAALRARAVE